MNKMNRSLAAVFLMILWAFSVNAKADTIYNNLSSTTEGSDSVGVSAFGQGPLADSFSTGGSPFDLTGVQVLVSGSSTSTGSFSIFLLADNNTSPGAALGTIGTVSDSSLSSSPAALSFSTNVFLNANTRYWIELAPGSGGTSALWAWSMDQTAPGVAGEFFWNATFGVIPNAEGPYQMELSGVSEVTPIPEPSSLILFGSGIIGLAGALRKKLTG